MRDPNLVEVGCSPSSTGTNGFLKVHRTLWGFSGSLP